VSLTIRALLFFWPFFRRALFGDLTAKELVLANLHILVVYLCLGISILMQTYTTVELSVVKSEKLVLIESMCAKPDTPNATDTLLLRRQMFGDILK